MRPKTDGILESSLYVSDLPRSIRFYQDTFGFSVISEFGKRGCAMHAGPSQVLLLFKKGASRAISSPHDGDGELHFAFAIPTAELANWESLLQERGIAGGRETQLGSGRLEPLLSRPGSSFNRARHAGHVVGILKERAPSPCGDAHLPHARRFLPSTEITAGDSN